MRRLTSNSSICDAMKTHWGAVENRRFLQRFYSASMGFHRIADWRVGGESTHKSASFLYTSFVGRINIQILNYPESFHFIGEGQAILGVRRPSTDTTPSTDGLGPRLARNITLYCKISSWLSLTIAIASSKAFSISSLLSICCFSIFSNNFLTLPEIVILSPTWWKPVW